MFSLRIIFDLVSQHHKTFSFLAVFFSIIFLSQNTFADQMFANFSFGTTDVSNENYSESFSYDLSASYQHKTVLAKAGLFNATGFNHKYTSLHSSVRLRGRYIGAYYQFRPEDPIQIEVGGGLMKVVTIAEIEDKEVGTQSTMAPFIHIQSYYSLLRAVDVGCGYRYIHDVEGNNFNSIEFGARLRF